MTHMNCPKCGKFTKVLVRIRDHNDNLLLKCNKCNITYGRSIGYYLDVTGEMVPSISEIMVDSPSWKKMQSTDIQGSE